MLPKFQLSCPTASLLQLTDNLMKEVGNYICLLSIYLRWNCVSKNPIPAQFPANVNHRHNFCEIWKVEVEQRYLLCLKSGVGVCWNSHNVWLFCCLSCLAWAAARAIGIAPLLDPPSGFSIAGPWRRGLAFSQIIPTTEMEDMAMLSLKWSPGKTQDFLLILTCR